MGVTIKDVARETHLSISTISKYMNGGAVREKNRALIESAVRKLNYSPNSMARGLRASKTFRVGLVTGTVNSPHTATIISEIEKELTNQGYSLTYVGHEDDEARAKEYLDYMVTNGVDGMIVTLTGVGQDYLQSSRENNVPVVAVEECGTDTLVDCVQTDCAGGAYEIVEHLVKLGHKKIAIISGPDLRLTARERLKGYLRVLEDYEIPVRSEFILQGDFAYESGYKSIMKMWQLGERPTAVFISNYDMCVGAMAAIYDLGIQVPEDLSVVSFDDFELSVMVHPKLTTVKQPLIELADAASELIRRRIDGDYSDFPRRIRLKSQCIYRDSVLNLYEAAEDKSKVQQNREI